MSCSTLSAVNTFSSGRWLNTLLLTLPSLVINGRHGDEAVLCTADKTFALREITQSNSLLLCSLVTPQTTASSPMEAEGKGENAPRLCLKSNVSQMLELVPVVPRLERIVELLQGSVYEGEAEEKRKVS